MTNLIAWGPYMTPGGRTILLPSDGGHGSFSYADTSVYGQRGRRSQFYDVDINGYPYPTGYIIVPGPGGGARIPGGRKFGSRSTGFTPRGAVLLRLYR